MSYLDLGPDRIYYEIEGSGTPLLLLQGNTASYAHLHLMGDIAHYAKVSKVITMDYRGTGRSNRIARWPDDWYKQSALDACQLLDFLQIDQCQVVGSSGGAFIAFWLAIIAPERVESLVAESFRLDFPRRVNEIIQTTRLQVSEMQKQFWQMGHGPDWQEVINADTDFLQRFAKRYPDGWMDIPLGQIRQPVLLCGSQKDEMIPDIEEQLNFAAVQLQNAQIFLHPEGGHPLMWSKPEVFRQKVQLFFRL